VLCAATFAALLMTTCGSSGSPTSPTAPGSGSTTLTYVKDIQPILSADCVKCHSATDADAGVDLSTYASVMRVASAGDQRSALIRVTQPGGSMYRYLTGNATGKAGIIYDWVLTSHAAQQ
jgi:hypothetical protein